MKNLTKKKYFFGWENIKRLIKEIAKLYSDQPSFFSKKRIESGVAFIVAQWGMIFFLVKKWDGLDMSDLAIWAGIEFAVAGYMVHLIQKEKQAEASEEGK